MTEIKHDLQQHYLVHGLVLDGDLDLDAKRQFHGVIGDMIIDAKGMVSVTLGRANPVRIHLGQEPIIDLLPGDFVEGQYVGGRAVSFTHVERQETRTRVIFTTKDRMGLCTCPREWVGPHVDECPLKETP